MLRQEFDIFFSRVTTLRQATVFEGLREKGPLWVIYPYDSDAKFRTEVIYSRSIWQLDRLAIVQ